MESKEVSGIIKQAEELQKEFKEHSVAEFFKKNMQMLGLTGKIKTLTTIVHEYVTNSLDACEDAGILPQIEVKIVELGNEYYEVIVKDNGPGLTSKTVGKALGQLLAGTKFHRVMQSRGQQGIGAAGCTMLSLMTTGKPIQVISGTKKEVKSYELTIDPKKNIPKIIKEVELKHDFKGLLIKAKFKEVKYKRSEQGPLEYMRRTAIANPHTTIIFIEPSGEKHVFKRTAKTVPKPPIEVKPHPKGITVDDLITMGKLTSSRKTNSFLKNDFDRMGEKAVSEIQKKVKFDLNKDPAQLTWSDAEQIVSAIKTINFISPRTDGLRPIGENRIKASMQEILEPEFLTVIERKPTVYHGGYAFQVEVGIAYGGKAGRNTGKDSEGNEIRKAEIMRFANRVPLLFDAGGCALTKAVQSIDWKRYSIKDLDSEPITIFVHLLSVHIPYTGAGKQAVSSEEEIMEELRLALMDTGRKTYRFISGKKKEQERQMKKRIFMKYAVEIAIALSELTGKQKEKIEKHLLEIVMQKLKLDYEQQKLQEKK